MRNLYLKVGGEKYMAIKQFTAFCKPISKVAIQGRNHGGIRGIQLPFSQVKLDKTKQF